MWRGARSGARRVLTSGFQKMVPRPRRDFKRGVTHGRAMRDRPCSNTPQSLLERGAMLTIARIGLSFLVGVAAFYFVFWVPFSLVSFLPGHWLLATIGSLAAAIWAGRYTWRRTSEAHDGVLAMTLSGAL